MIFTLSSNHPTTLSKEFDGKPEGTEILFTNNGVAINYGVKKLNKLEVYNILQRSSSQYFDLLSRYYANRESFYNLFDYEKDPDFNYLARRSQL